MDFERLVRYEAGGSVYFGELVESNDTGFKVKRLGQNLESGFSTKADEVESVTKVCPSSRCHRVWHVTDDAGV
jgi:hypothetical protein